MLDETKKKYLHLEMQVHEISKQDVVTASPGGTLYDPKDDYGFDNFAPIGIN